jgi:selenophosphate synthetase-related protein
MTATAERDSPAADDSTGLGERGELGDLIDALRANPSLRAKAAIGLVAEVFGDSDWLTGPGDDGAAVPIGGSTVIACGEALWPPFVRRDPFGAGVAAVLANVNDLAAMGATPLGIVDTIVADAEVARQVLQGMRHACALYDVPLLGGHLTDHTGEPAVSAFGVGEAQRPLSVANARLGQSLVVACATEGDMRSDFPFFRSFVARADQCIDDIRLLRTVADSGDCVAAKDISMAGLVGSLAMLLEHSHLGVTVDLDRVPRPDGVPLELWLRCFPSFGFLLCVPEGREESATGPFHERGLEAVVVGRLDDTGLLRLRLGSHEATAIDLNHEPVTGLKPVRRSIPDPMRSPR